MSKLVILSAPSGTGKSTLAKDMALALHSQGKICYILSTDNYWIQDGEYKFNPKMLGAAHEWNFQKFKNLVQEEDLLSNDITVIIDNTNLRWSEFSKYIETALLSKWDIEITKLSCPYTDEELFKRNIHNVPVETIHRQRERWQPSEHFQNQLEILKKKLGVPQ